LKDLPDKPQPTRTDAEMQTYSVEAGLDGKVANLWYRLEKKAGTRQLQVSWFPGLKIEAAETRQFVSGSARFIVDDHTLDKVLARVEKNPQARAGLATVLRHTGKVCVGSGRDPTCVVVDSEGALYVVAGATAPHVAEKRPRATGATRAKAGRH
jgi:hypothetical protein